MSDIQDMLMRMFMSQMMSSKTPDEKERDRLLLEGAKFDNEMGAVSLIDSLVQRASTPAEFEVLNKNIDSTIASSSVYDPKIQMLLDSSVQQASEKSELFENFRKATDDAQVMYGSGEFDNYDINTILTQDYMTTAEKVREVNRIKNTLTIGQEYGFTYTPKPSQGQTSKPIDSSKLLSRLNEYSGQIDAAVYQLADKDEVTDGKIMPMDAARMVLMGDTAGLKDLKTRDTNKAKQNFNTHSSRYNWLLNEKMDSDTKKSPDNTITLNPSIMMQDLKDKGDGSLEAFTEAIKADQSMYNDFMNGAQNNRTVTVDYDVYSHLLDQQMTFESANAKSSNTEYRSWTGEDVGTLTEGIDFEAADKQLKDKGLDEITPVVTSLPKQDPLPPPKEKKEAVKGAPPTKGTIPWWETEHHKRFVEERRKKFGIEPSEEKPLITLKEDVGFPTTQVSEKYKTDMREEKVIGRQIQASNKAIQGAWNTHKDKFQGTVDYNDFANSLINEWNSVPREDKIMFGSFENFVKMNVYREDNK